MFVAIWVPSIGDVGGLTAECYAVYQRNSVAGEQSYFLTVGIEFEICVQAGIGCVFVGPYQQVALRRDNGPARIGLGYLPLG
jgi:hypothetical protein